MGFSVPDRQLQGTWLWVGLHKGPDVLAWGFLRGVSSLWSAAWLGCLLRKSKEIFTLLNLQISMLEEDYKYFS